MEHLVREKQDSLEVQLPDVGGTAGFPQPNNILCKEEQRSWSWAAYVGILVSPMTSCDLGLFTESLWSQFLNL